MLQNHYFNNRLGGNLPLTPTLSLRERENYAKHFVFLFVIARYDGWGAHMKHFA